MKKITLEDVNNAIIGTDIKILDYINITDLSDIKSYNLQCYGVYILYYKHEKSYIGMSYNNKKYIASRLSNYIHEVHQRNLIDYIDVFTTNELDAKILEILMIKKFKPELNEIMFTNYSILESYKEDFGKEILSWIKSQKERQDPVGDLSRDLIQLQKMGVVIRNVIDYERYITLHGTFVYQIGRSEKVYVRPELIIETLNTACNEHIELNKHLILDYNNINNILESKLDEDELDDTIKTKIIKKKPIPVFTNQILTNNNK